MFGLFAWTILASQPTDPEAQFGFTVVVEALQLLPLPLLSVRRESPTSSPLGFPRMLWPSFSCLRVLEMF